MDQYTSDLLIKWGLLDYVEIFDGARIDIISLQMLEDRDIEQLITPIGDRLKFKANLSLWKEENKKSNSEIRREPTNGVSFNSSFMNDLIDLDSVIETGSSKEVSTILMKSIEGRSILAQAKKTLTPYLRRELSNIIVQDQLTDDPTKTI